MKSKRIYALVLVAGLAAGAAGQSFAASTIEQITAYINHSFKLTVDGEQTELPDGYEMLVYENRTYVPVRAIGEMVGAGVDWDDQTKTVMITKPASQPEEGNSSTGTEDGRTYQKLPITKETEKYKVSVLTYSTDVKDHFPKLGIRLEALDSTNVRINQAKTVYEIDGKTYEFNESTNHNYRDEKWYTSFAKKDSILEGYLVLPEIQGEMKNIHMTITVVLDTYEGQKSEEQTFDIAL